MFAHRSARATGDESDLLAVRRESRIQIPMGPRNQRGGFSGRSAEVEARYQGTDARWRSAYDRPVGRRQCRDRSDRWNRRDGGRSKPMQCFASRSVRHPARRRGISPLRAHATSETQHLSAETCTGIPAGDMSVETEGAKTAPSADVPQHRTSQVKLRRNARRRPSGDRTGNGPPDRCRRYRSAQRPH